MKWKKLFQTMLSLIAAAVVIFAALPICEAEPAEEVTEDGFSKYIENENLALYISDTAEFFVLDKQTGAKWYSNSQSRADDPIAQGMASTNLSSLLYLSVYDLQNGYTETTNSFSGSVLAEGFRLRKMKSGVEFCFTFPDYQVTVPLQIRLEDDHILAKIPLNKIEESTDFQVYTISVLPNFGAGGPQDEGFLVIPDGCGAVVEFNREKTSTATYSEYVYGRDLSDEQKTASAQKETVHLPCFGISNQAGSLMGIISNGDAQSKLNAYCAGQQNSYNGVYSEVEYRRIGRYTINQGRVDEKEFEVFQTQMPKLTSYEVRYYFGSPGLDNIVSSYRRYLQETYQLQEIDGQHNNAELEFIGGVSKQQSFLGIPMTRVFALTTLNDLVSVAEELKANGLQDISFQYSNFIKDNIYHKSLSSFDVSSKLGSNSKLKKTTKDLAEQGYSLTPMIDGFSFQKQRFPFQRYFTATRNINGAIAFQNIFRLNTYQNISDQKWYIIRSKNQLKTAEKLAKTLTSLELGSIGLEQLGTNNYSDFSNDYLERQEKIAYDQKIAAAYGQSRSVTLQCANQYMFQLAGKITDVPLVSSGHDIFDYDIPFYQMALSGMIPMTSQAINDDFAPDQMFLKAVISGAVPKFTFIYRNLEKVRDTEYDSLIGADYHLWKQEMMAYISRYEKIKAVTGAISVNHYAVNEESGLCRSTLTNGMEMLANCGSAETETAYGILGAGKLAIAKDGELIYEER